MPDTRRSTLDAFIYTCRVGDGNLREATADFSLESLGAPSILLFPQNLNWYERKRRVRHIHVPVTVLIALPKGI